MKKNIKSDLLTLMLSMMFVVSLSVTPSMADNTRQKGGDETYLSPPVGLRILERAEDAGKRISLTWRCVEGAFGYRVYRSEEVEGPFVDVGGKAGDSMLDYPVFLDDTAEVGREYYYKVATVDEDGRESAPSQEVKALLDEVYRASAGPKRIICSLFDQRLYFFEGDQLVNITRCSTGLNNRTPAGNFAILGHKRVNVGLGGAVCDWWMSFTSAHGMHSWPRGSRYSYEKGLGAPASHGCIRQHPLEAYWPYNWAPDGTPLNITWASLAGRVIQGCHDSMGVARPSETWYFAEGYTAEAFDTYLLLANPGDQEVTVEVDFMLEGGADVEHACIIPPRSRHTVAVDELPGMASAAFSTLVEADGEVVAERAMYFGKEYIQGGHSSVGVARPSETWYFAEGCTHGFFQTYLMVGNPGLEDAVVDVCYLLSDGSMRYSYLVEARSRITIEVDAQPGLEAEDVSFAIYSNHPVVAERSVYYDLDSHRGGHASLGAAAPSTSWHFSEGYSDGAFDTYLLLSNPSFSAAGVDIVFQRDDGANFYYHYLLPPQRRLNVFPDERPELSRAAFSTVISSDVPIVAERAMYFVMGRGY